MTIPEAVHLDAVKAYDGELHDRSHYPYRELPYGYQKLGHARALRAAIASAYRAGYGQGRDDEAAGLDLPDLIDPATQE